MLTRWYLWVGLIILLMMVIGGIIYLFLSQSIQQWIIDNKDLIAGFSALATMVAMFVGVIALGFTAYQVNRNTRMNRAKTIYDIHGDARETSKWLRSDAVVMKGVFGKTLNDEERIEAAWSQIFNFYAAVFQQWELDVIDTRLWNQFMKEICIFLKQPGAQERWNTVKEYHEQRYVTFVDNLISTMSGSDIESQEEGGNNGGIMEHSRS